MMEFKLGSKLRDKVTAFEGIATSRVEYLNGCVQYCIVPKVGKDSKRPDGEYFDIGQLELVGDGVSIKPSDTGGLQRDCPSY
jgi:hypothetical protein